MKKKKQPVPDRFLLSIAHGYDFMLCTRPVARLTGPLNNIMNISCQTQYEEMVSGSGKKTIQKKCWK